MTASSSKMAKLRSNRGSVLIELVLVILVISGMSSLILIPVKTDPLAAFNFQSTVIHTHFMALLKHQTLSVDTSVISDYPIHFNPEGYVNMGQTIRIGNKELVLLIASGRIREKSLFDD